jgi:uncharacterized protein YqhQ
LGKKSFGGQAVIEGVMMRGGETVAIAVRKPNREIVVHKTTIYPAARRWPILKLPILRGVVALVESLSIGIGALTYSANQAAEEEEQLSAREMALSVVIALAVGAGLFIVLPTVLVRLLNPQAAQGTRVIYLNLLEGAIRIGIFLLYIIGISLLKDIQRFFAYHGAEHKVIHAYEAGKPLTTEEILPMSPLHPRCGTAFLLYVMVVSILVFSLLGWQSLAVRVLSRLALLPVVAGLAYELIRLGGRVKSPLLRLVLGPGLLLQRLTTREPDAGQIEVAVRALEAVLAEEG